jgi:hypothetical protein
MQFFHRRLNQFAVLDRFGWRWCGVPPLRPAQLRSNGLVCGVIAAVGPHDMIGGVSGIISRLKVTFQIKENMVKSSIGQSKRSPGPSISLLRI